MNHKNNLNGMVGQVTDAPGGAVNHPKHYNTGSIEVITAIEDWDLEFHEGNVVKYVARAKHKNDQLEDLKKAQWYLNKKIELLTKGKNSDGVSK